MLTAIDTEQFDQELRLFLVACAKRVLQYLAEDEFARALDCSTRFANRAATKSELAVCVRAASDLVEPHIDIPTVRAFAASAVIDASSVHLCTKSKVANCISCAAQAIAQADAGEASDDDYDTAFDRAYRTEVGLQCAILREMIPNPLV